MDSMLGVLCLVACVNLLSARRLKLDPRATRTAGRVSLLIPARNEEENLRALLPIDDAAEVLVLDDGSSDATAQYATHAGAPLPRGWTGKNWACHQLAQHATGDILIFMDADVRPSRGAVAATAALMRAQRADVLTAFPQQRFGGLVDAAVLPLVYQLPIAALLPLALVPRLRAASVSGGNGQWLAFTRVAYERIGGHAAVRGDVMEDVALARLAKRARLRVLPVLGAELLAVRMYADRAALYHGVCKNIVRIPGLLLLLPLLLLSLLNPLAYLLRLLAAALFRQPLRTVLLHPAGVLLVTGLLLSAAVRRQHTWKGRAVPA